MPNPAQTLGGSSLSIMARARQARVSAAQQLRITPAPVSSAIPTAMRGSVPPISPQAGGAGSPDDDLLSLTKAFYASMS